MAALGRVGAAAGAGNGAAGRVVVGPGLSVVLVTGGSVATVVLALGSTATDTGTGEGASVVLVLVLVVAGFLVVFLFVVLETFFFVVFVAFLGAAGDLTGTGVGAACARGANTQWALAGAAGRTVAVSKENREMSALRRAKRGSCTTSPYKRP